MQAPVRGSGNPVILIVVDTLRADHLSLNGYSRPTSPALADWAKRGAHFQRTYATSPWTLPSFGSILTGMSPSSHAAGLLVPAQGDARHPDAAGMSVAGVARFFARLDSDVPTLAEILREAGYATGAIVNNPFLHKRFGLAAGFQDYNHESGNDAVIRPADQMVDLALAWVDGHQAEPFFLMLHLFDPHMNYDAPAPVRGRFTLPIPSRYALPIVDTPAIRSGAKGIEVQDRRFITAAYDEEVAFVDQEIGRFLRALEGRGLTGSALIIITADHGEELFDHESFGHGHSMYEELLRVPLLILGKGVSAGRAAVPVSIMDVTPTVLDALELPVPDAIEGVSLWPTAHEGTPPAARLIFCERMEAPPERKAVVQWPYKLSSESNGASATLYDLSKDPRESKEIAAEHPKLKSLLQQRLEMRFDRDAGRESATRPEVDADTLERLRALGYLN